MLAGQYHHLFAGGNRKNAKLEQYLDNDRRAGKLSKPKDVFVKWTHQSAGFLSVGEDLAEGHTHKANCRSTWPTALLTSHL